MAVNTSRISLRKPGYTDPEFVIPDINNNWDKIDAFINANTFTSSTRPLDTYDGRLIYETDTKLVAIFLTGSGWGYIGGDGYARGKRAVITSDVNSGTTTIAEIGPFISVTFTAEAGRRYWVETAFCLDFTGAPVTASYRPRIRWAAGASVTTAGTQLGSDIISNTVYGPGFPQDYWHQFEFVPNINGNVSVGLFLAGIDSARTIFFAQAVDRSAMLFVRDVGST